MGGEWGPAPLGEVVRNFDSQRIPLSSRERAARRGRYRYFGATGVMDWVDGFLFEGLHLLVAEDGSVERADGRPFLQLVDGPFWVNNHAHVLKGHTDADTTFLYYALSTVAIRPYISGSVQAKLSQGNLNRILVPYPANEADRRAIAKALRALDDKIDLNRRMSETLEAMARALFKSWFVDFDPVRANAEGREPGLPRSIANSFPSSFQNSELGEIPNGWRVEPLENILAELETGGRPKGGVSGITGGVPSIGAESIVGLGIFDYSKTKYVPRDYFDGMRKGHVRGWDVLLYKDGGRPGLFEPHVTLVGDGFPFEVCAINEHVYRLRAKEGIGQGFLHFSLSSEAVMEQMRIRGTGVAIPGLNSAAVRSLKTLVPTPAVALVFERAVEPLVSRLLRACLESRTLAALRDTLLPKLISGEVRIPDAERIVGEVA